MSKDHPRYKEGTIGTGEPVWKDVQGNPTVDTAQRAYKNAVGELVSSETPGAILIPAVGWKIDLLRGDGSIYLNDRGQPGWSTYAKYIDVKPVFAGREFPTDFPKVAATHRQLSTLVGPKTLEQYGTQHLTSIVHKLEKIMRKHGKIGENSWEANGATISIFDAFTPHTGKGLRIKKGDQYYKIMLTQKYDRKNNRHAWSVYIDDQTEQAKTHSSRTGKNFKLAPEGDAHFTARICKDTNDIHREDMLSSEEITLLETVDTLLK